MRTIHGTLKRLLCALYYRYRTCCVVHAGRWCAPSCVDADKTWSITGALGVMAAALPARAGLRYLLTAVRQALKDRSSWLRQTRTFLEGSLYTPCILSPYLLQVWFALVGQLLAAARIVKL